LVLDPPQQLYHTQDDIRERHNQYFEEPDVVEWLTELFAEQKRAGVRRKPLPVS
jgi:hypothetical protein